jgi:hypothetical protein
VNMEFAEFGRVFRENIHKRSRTAKGESNTGVSSKKRPLKLQGEALSAQVAANTTVLINSVWSARTLWPQSAMEIRALMELWYDIINDDLHETGADAHVVNPRYRTWEVSYGTRNVLPHELDRAMDRFYDSLLVAITHAKAGKMDPEELLAFADFMIDTEIHPWVDGCGRHATATVMWLAALVGLRPPVFGPREEHYRAIRDINTHVEYMRSCINVGA